MKLMRKHLDLYDLNLGLANRVVGHAKHCTGCLVANRRLGARAAYNHCLTKVATSPGECYFADVGGAISPLGIGGAKCCDTRQCRCGYRCTCYGLVHGRLTICLSVLSRVRNIL